MRVTGFKDSGTDPLVYVGITRKTKVLGKYYLKLVKLVEESGFQLNPQTVTRNSQFGIRAFGE